MANPTQTVTLDRLVVEAAEAKAVSQFECLLVVGGGRSASGAAVSGTGHPFRRVWPEADQRLWSER